MANLTEHFFPYLDLNTDSDPLIVSKILVSTEFEKIISILPKVFNKDGHMRPQYHAQKVTLNVYGYRLTIPIKFKHIFKIEDKQSLQRIEQIFNIDLSKSKNVTKHIDDSVIWSNDIVKTIKTLYKKDYQI